MMALAAPPPAPRRARALAIACCCLLVAVCRAAPGYNEPVATNDAWAYYQFNVTTKPKTTTSIPVKGDANAPGSLLVYTNELFDASGKQIGIGSYTRQVMGDRSDVPGHAGSRVLVNMANIHYEFGAPNQGFYDDTIAVILTSKRTLSQVSGFADVDGAVVGGTGRWLGATGSMDIPNNLYINGTTRVQRSLLVFNVWVPRNLPRPPCKGTGCPGGRRL